MNVLCLIVLLHPGHLFCSTHLISQQLPLSNYCHIGGILLTRDVNKASTVKVKVKAKAMLPRPTRPMPRPIVQPKVGIKV